MRARTVGWLMLFASAVAMAAPADDPLRSPLWTGMKQRFLADATVVFDERVQVRLPAAAEDSLQVPVEVAVAGIERVERIVVFADLNPIPKILEYRPASGSPWFAFRLKVEQSTPVRAAVRDGEGIWHVGGAWVSAAGGGCTMPSVGNGKPLWQERIGEVSARLWPRPAGHSRLRLRIIHPMDTGLAAGIPVFHLDQVRFLADDGRDLGTFTLYEPVAENPVLSLDLAHAGAVRIEGVDTQGHPVAARVAP